MVDVCLILEETYPYVIGGVSSWVHSLLRGLPDIQFSLIHITADSRKSRPSRFDLPSNLREIVEIEVDWHRGWDNVLGQLAGDFEIPESGIYHALSTGLAGMAGVRIKKVTQRPFLLTEHGIYWREIESGANELETGFKIICAGGDRNHSCASRESWTTTFQDLARIAYGHADEIITVCRANQSLQLACGAPPEKCSVIPNGVDLPNDCCSPPKRFGADSCFRIGFVGRIAPIKDVKTLIRACSIVAGKQHNTELLLIGPMRADSEYYLECRELAQEVRPIPRLMFVGATDPQHYYPILNVVALTSISEGQPLALLEAMSHGLPVVASDVGGCPELVYGMDERDSEIGAAGIIVPPGNPEAVADAILRIAHDSRLARSMSDAARRRVQTLYTRDQFIRSYQALYEKHTCGQVSDAPIGRAARQAAQFLPEGGGA